MSAHSKGPNPSTQNAAALAKTKGLSGTYRSPSRVNAMLERASREYHLVSPMTSCPKLPEGCEVSLTLVFVDLARETYPVGGEDGPSGKRGLSKTALDRIAAAAGISWDVRGSGRVDDGSDARYCFFRAVGYVQNFDGTPREIGDHKELDLRDGSDEVESHRDRYRHAVAKWERDGRKGYAPRPPDAQIRELRRHIVSHAETKARNRAIRSIGVRTSYEKEELSKSFAVAKLMFTGASSDPELRRGFALQRGAALIQGMGALYGEARAPETLGRVKPPPVGTRTVEDDEDDEDAPKETIDPVTGEVTHAPVAAKDAPPSSPAAPRVRPPARATSSATAPSLSPSPAPSVAAGARPMASEFTMPGGREKGTPIASASDEQLAYWANRLANNVTSGESFRPEADEAWVAAANAEIDRRLAAAKEDEIPY